MSNNPASAKDHIHMIVSGETLSKIAARYNLSVEALLAANPEISNPNKIMVGQRLKIPTAPSAVPADASAADGATAAPQAQPSTGLGLPDTAGMSEAQKFDLYSAYYRQLGVDIGAMEPEKRAILGLRVKSSVFANDGRGEYNDRLVLAWRGSDGSKRIKEFKANTEPSGLYEDSAANRRNRPGKIMGSDADRDGRKDLGCLPDGLFHYCKDRSSTYGSVLRPVKDIYVVRDIDHDGDFDEQDKKRASIESALNSGRSILFHKGGANMTGSAGCQTMQAADFNNFWNSLGNQKEFQYVLVTV